MTRESIKDAICLLPQPDPAALVNWLINEQDWTEWDEQIEEDFSGADCGTVRMLQLEREIAADESRPNTEGFAERDRDHLESNL